MTTATDHKNNLNRSVLKKDYARTLRVETNSQLSRRNSTGINRSSAKYRIPEHQNTTPMVPLRKIRKTASAESLSDSPGPNR